MTSLARYVFLLFVLISLAVVALTESSRGADEQERQPQKLDGREGRDLLLREFRPRPMLRVAEHQLHRSRFPSVDIHTHPSARLRGSAEALTDFVSAMDGNNIAVCVSLDGRLGAELAEHLAYLKPYENRFVVFANIDWQGTGEDDRPETWSVNQSGFVRQTVEALREARRQGAVGLKIFKGFGLTVKNVDGSLLQIDDRRLDPIWQTCGELKLPILIHTADPASFFEPIDQFNERWAELQNYPEWSFAGSEFPRRDELLAARNRVIKRHPNTKFIGAHVANSSEDLSVLGGWLEEFPNLYVDIAARISELGRQPYTARAFFEKYQDRILFGTDGPRPARLMYYWRFLETYDEYFPYADLPVPPKGFWRIYGIGLSDDVLRKVYHQNACRLIPEINEKWERATSKARSMQK
ncbi:MAG: amidohydrolase [Pirellulales bacterium]|nr:amidohydrolase [Pirellulales bacterium]